MRDTIDMAREAGAIHYWHMSRLKAFEALVRADERKAIYFKEFDRQEEDFDGEAANAMKAMAFSLTAAIRARGNT